MTRKADALPPGLTPRGLTTEAAAAFCGLSANTFTDAVRAGKYPDATLPGGRYDVELLRAAMNRMSGLIPEGEVVSPLDHWRSKRHAS